MAKLKIYVKPCVRCGNTHNLGQCERFIGLNVDQHRDVVIKNRCCFNYLGVGQIAVKCLS